MNNTHRAEYVECLVVNLLGNAWTLPWAEGWDWVFVAGTSVGAQSFSSFWRLRR